MIETNVSRSLFLVQEYAPYFVEGGLGVAARMLPKLLQKNHGLEHTVVLPYYGDVEGLNFEIIEQYTVETPKWGVIDYAISNLLDGTKNVFFIHCEKLYERGRLYGPSAGEDYTDSNERCIFYGLAIKHWIEQSNLKFDVVHANEWQTAFALYCVKEALRQKVKCIYNIHNYEYKGIFDIDVIPSSMRKSIQKTLIQCECTFLDLGVEIADILITCSLTYRSELIVASPINSSIRSKPFYGVTAGIDASYWSPGNEQVLAHTFNQESFVAGKSSNKKILQKTIGLKECANHILIGISSRFVTQKGIPELVHCLDYLLTKGRVQVFLMGSVETLYQDDIDQLSLRHVGKIKHVNEFETQLAFLLYAGSDFTFMPSRYEPCGLNQQIAQSFGTIPVCAPVGGLLDTISCHSQNKIKGNGFLVDFTDIDCAAVEIEQIFDWFRHDIEERNALIMNALLTDNSWNNTGKIYAEIYNRLLQNMHITKE